MPIITKIERQKHRDTRVSVFVDDEYAFSLADELILQYDVRVNKNVNDLPLEEMMREDEYRRCFTAAMRHLSHADKSEREMRDFLRRKAFEEATAERVLARLKELSYVDDEQLARLYAERADSLGKQAIRAKLRQKGVADELIRSVLEDISDESQLEAALELGQRQKSRLKDEDVRKQKQKLAGFLARRGFEWETVKTVVERVWEDEA